MTMNRFLGISIDGYKIIESLGSGAIGSVYLGEKNDVVHDQRAFKFIPEKNLRPTWQNEINKVTQLTTTPGIVPYISHDTIDIAGENYTWIAWKYIKGKSLDKLCSTNEITVPLLCDIIETILGVLHACKIIGIEHGDLHSGNIIIEDSNELNITPGLRRIWITDFGYLSSSNGSDMLDDFMGTIRVIKESLQCINIDELDGKNKHIYLKLKNEYTKSLAESDATQGDWVRDPRRLLSQLNLIKSTIDNITDSSVASVGDYLAAETIGDRYGVWKELFVPVFAGSDDLLSRNICVLTGLRGCGKTMVFRRLTAIYDFHLGPSKIKNSNTFIGLYLNARNIAEAFPWLPDSHVDIARDQVIHFFHSSWCIEILTWLDIYSKNEKVDMTWLADFFKDHLVNLTYASGTNLVSQLQSRFLSEINQSRLSTEYKKRSWTLTRLDFLDLLCESISKNMPKVCQDKIFYFFLDDYSTPMVSENIQRILNPIIFRRSSICIFKIATESIESIIYVGLNNKTLEQEDDFILVDSGSQTLSQSETKNQEIISMILQPRIDMDRNIRLPDARLSSILGTNQMSNTKLAETLRSKDQTLYWGKDFFVRLWSSNTRELIELFSRLIDAGNQNYDGKESMSYVSKEDQNRLFRDAGARYLDLLSSAVNPSGKLYQYAADETYGRKLRDIADAVQLIARFELMNKTSKNQDRVVPKQARRIEITDMTRNLPDDLAQIYKGLIRYGLFVRDIRGKSVRGRPNPRHFLRSILIPFYTLTFSKRDSISMSWDQFCSLLRDPKVFAENWVKNEKQKEKDTDSGQKALI